MYHSFIIMVIVVKYFASISDAVGKTSEKIVLQHEMTVGEVWTDVSKNIKYARYYLSSKAQMLPAVFSLPSSVRQEYIACRSRLLVT